MVFSQTAGEGAVRAFFDVYLDTALAVPSTRIGAIFGLGQLLSILPLLIVPRLLTRWGTAHTSAVATLGMGIALVSLAAFPHWRPATLGFRTMMAMTAVTGTVRAIFSQEIVVARWRTPISAVTTIGLALGWANTTAVGGYLVANHKGCDVRG